ncbi:hypothetical protein Agub_g8310, partial [Astrephomene gubernaculifera]
QQFELHPYSPLGPAAPSPFSFPSLSTPPLPPDHPQGDSPEASQFPRVLPPLTGLRDLKLLSRLGSYGLGAEELEALAAAACPQLQRLQVELCPDGEEFGPRGAEEVLRAMTRLRGLRCLQLDFTAISLGAEVVEALRELRELQELSLVVNDPEHLADLFSLPALERLSLHYQSFDIPAPYDLGPPPPPPPPRLHEDDEDEWDSEDDEDSEDEGPEQTDTVTCLTLAMSMLAQLVRGTAKRPVLLSLDVSCCVVNADLLARLALLTSLTSLSIEECRWTRVPDQSGADYIDAAAIRQRRTRPWIVLTSLTRLTSLHLQINGAPPIPESDVTALAAALTGLRSLKVFNPMHRDWQPRLPPVNFNAYVSNWRQLESLVLCSPFPYDPRVTLDAALLPPSLTNLGLAHLTLTRGSSSCCATAATSEAAGDKSSSSFEAPAMMPGAGTTEQQHHHHHHHHHHHQQHQQAAAFPPDSSSDAPSGPASSLPALPALESLALKCVRLGSGVSLGALLGAAPGLRSLGVRNPLPRLTDSCCAAFSALTALTTLRVEQAASAYDAMMQAEAGAPACEQRQDSGEEQQQEGADEREGAADGASLEGTGSEGSYYDGEWLSGAGLTVLTGLRNLRQLQWLPYAGEQVRPEQVEVLSSLQRLQLLTLPSYDVNDDMGRVVLETVREKMPLCDVIKFRRGFSMEGEDVDEETEEGSSA